MEFKKVIGKVVALGAAVGALIVAGKSSFGESLKLGADADSDNGHLDELRESLQPLGEEDSDSDEEETIPSEDEEVPE